MKNLRTSTIWINDLPNPVETTGFFTFLGFGSCTAYCGVPSEKAPPKLSKPIYCCRFMEINQGRNLLEKEEVQRGGIEK